MNSALAALPAPSPDPASALGTLTDIGFTCDDLQAERDRQVTELDARLNGMAAVLEPLPEQIAAMH